MAEEARMYCQAVIVILVRWYEHPVQDYLENFDEQKGRVVDGTNWYFGMAQVNTLEQNTKTKEQQLKKLQIVHKKSKSIWRSKSLLNQLC